MSLNSNTRSLWWVNENGPQAHIFHQRVKLFGRLTRIRWSRCGLIGRTGSMEVGFEVSKAHARTSVVSVCLSLLGRRVSSQVPQLWFVEVTNLKETGVCLSGGRTLAGALWKSAALPLPLCFLSSCLSMEATSHLPAPPHRPPFLRAKTALPSASAGRHKPAFVSFYL